MMSDKQVDFNGNVVEDEVKFDDVVNIKTLMNSLIRAENRYMVKKFYNEMDYYEMMLTEDWDTVNKERVGKGLPKLGNQDMKKAYVKHKMMDEYDEEKYLELEYLRFQRMYDVAMKLKMESIK